MISKERKSIKSHITNRLSITARGRETFVRLAFTQSSLPTLLAFALLIGSLPGFSDSPSSALAQPAAASAGTLSGIQ